MGATPALRAGEHRLFEDDEPDEVIRIEGRPGLAEAIAAGDLIMLSPPFGA